MSRSLSAWQAVLLGVAVVLALAIAGYGVFAVGSRQWLWSDTFHVRVGFPQIEGVEAGTRVRIRGRDAGEVESVELPASPSGQVMLCLRIDGRLRHLVRADASAQIVSEGMVGGKVVEIHPGTEAVEPVQDGALIAAVPTKDWTTVLNRMDAVLQGINRGEGSLGKLVKDEEAYHELVKSVRQIRGTMASLKQDADAIKGMPVVRNYVQDPYRELVRPDCECNRRWFREADLFPPGRAVLTTQGRQRLDELAPWLDGLKHKGSEVVVVTYAYPNLDPDLAQALTQKQSEAVCTYLKEQHAVHKMGWFSRRKVAALGLGTEAPPLPEKEPLPLPRTEILVFVPQG